MRLAKTAQWADKTKLYDAYTGVYLFPAQVSSFIDNQMDGSISKRRPISFAPRYKMPARRVIQYAGEVWVVGDTLKDMHQGEVIRVSAACKRATGLYSILTPGEAAKAATGVPAYAQLTYLKDTVDTTTTSMYSPQFEIFFAAPEQVQERMLIRLGQAYYHVRSTYPVLDGFVCAVCDNLGHARKPVVFKQRGAYDKTSDSYPVVDVPANVIELDYYKLYDKPTADSYKQVQGDLTLLVSNLDVTPAVGENIDYLGATWKILGVAADQDAWRTHVRRL